MPDRQKPPRGKSASKKEKPKPEPFEIVIEFSEGPADPSNPAASADPNSRTDSPKDPQRLTFRFGEGS